MRVSPNKLGIKPENISDWLEPEREERVFKNIKNLGRYIKYIEMTNINSTKEEFIKNYIKKYPHIEVRIINKRFGSDYYTTVNLADVQS